LSKYVMPLIVAVCVVVAGCAGLDDLFNFDSKGTVTGVVQLEGQTDHSDISVVLNGTTYIGKTTSGGNYIINAPVGQYTGLYASKYGYDSQSISHPIIVRDDKNIDFFQVTLKNTTTRKDSELKVQLNLLRAKVFDYFLTNSAYPATIDATLLGESVPSDSYKEISTVTTQNPISFDDLGGWRYKPTTGEVRANVEDKHTF
jgi:hypothetical protein